MVQIMSGALDARIHLHRASCRDLCLVSLWQRHLMANMYCLMLFTC